jgi:hypothetical protein
VSLSSHVKVVSDWHIIITKSKVAGNTDCTFVLITCTVGDFFFNPYAESISPPNSKDWIGLDLYELN